MPRARVLTAYQSGPALLQAFVSYSVQMEQGDAVERFVVPIGDGGRCSTLRTPSMPFVEARDDNEAMFTVETPKELANVAIPSVTGTLDARPVHVRGRQRADRVLAGGRAQGGGRTRSLRASSAAARRGIWAPSR